MSSQLGRSHVTPAYLPTTSPTTLCIYILHLWTYPHTSNILTKQVDFSHSLLPPGVPSVTLSPDETSMQMSGLTSDVTYLAQKPSLDPPNSRGLVDGPQLCVSDMVLYLLICFFSPCDCILRDTRSYTHQLS